MARRETREEQEEAPSKGFPWTTGFVTVSHPSALGGPEIFFLSGTDMRVAGVGNLSLVSGSLSRRALSGPNANRAWLSLNLVPEPGPRVALESLGDVEPEDPLD